MSFFDPDTDDLRDAWEAQIEEIGTEVNRARMYLEEDGLTDHPAYITLTDLLEPD